MDKINNGSVKDDNRSNENEGELIFCNTEEECYGNNRSWDHCHHGEWIQLYMRLGMFPEEACKVKRREKWSILHEACSSVVYDDDAGQTKKNDGIRKQSLSSSRNTFKHNNVVSPMVLRAIHFACPPSRMLQESRNGETPLHCAIQEQHQTQQIMSLSSSNEEETTTNNNADSGEGCQQQHQDENVVDVVQAVLQMNLDEDLEEDDDDYDHMGVVMEVTTDEEECCCAVVDYDDTTDNDDSRASPTPVRRISSIQNNMGDTPFLKACRVGCSVNVFAVLMENTPKHYLTQSDMEGLYPLQRLWTELMHRSNNEGLNYKSRIEKICKWEDLVNDIELKATWDKSVLLLRKLYTGNSRTSTPMRIDNNTRRWDLNSVGSPRLDFPLLRAIASTDSFADLMKLAITLYPEEQVFTDAQGNNAVSEAIVARLSSHPEGSLGNIHLREVLMVLQQNEDLGTLLYSQMNTSSTKNGHAIDSTAVLPQADITSEGGSSLHVAILEGKGWTNDIETICKENPSVLKERFPGTFMFPFMLAATVNKTSTGKQVPDEDIAGLVFELLRKDPSLIEHDSSSTLLPHNPFLEDTLEDDEEIENFYFSGDKRKTTDQTYSKEEGTKRQAYDESTANEI